MSEQRQDSRSWLRDPSSWQRRTASAVAGVALLLAAWVSMVLGACHSRGGFCASEFQNDHAGLLVLAVLLAAAAGWTLSSAATRARLPRIVTTAVLTTVAIVWAVSTLP